jgi:hypothetical protein
MLSAKLFAAPPPPSAKSRQSHSLRLALADECAALGRAPFRFDTLVGARRGRRK